MKGIDYYLEKFLEFSTWFATALVALGVMTSNHFITTSGIAFFILIPVCRVIGLGITFFKQKDYQMTLVASFVFCIILVSFLFGLKTS